MLSFATDFWPLFWTITGGAALLTALLSVLIATISPAAIRPRRRPELALATAQPAGRPQALVTSRTGTPGQPDPADQVSHSDSVAEARLLPAAAASAVRADPPSPAAARASGTPVPLRQLLPAGRAGRPYRG